MKLEDLSLLQMLGAMIYILYRRLGAILQQNFLEWDSNVSVKGEIRVSFH